MIKIAPTRILFALLVFVSNGCFSESDQYTKGLDAYDKQQYFKAYQYWEALASKGDLKAQLALANMFEEKGSRLGKDRIETIKWYKHAANQGSLYAAMKVGTLLAETGSREGIKAKDSKTKTLRRDAITYFKLAAKNHKAEAEYSIAYYYRRWGNKRLALKWWEHLASHGHGGAMNWAGESYFYGYGVKKDYAKARTYWVAATKTIGVRSKSFIHLGNMYLKGYGVKKDVEQALQWYARAKGNPDAQVKIGMIYEQGLGVEKDLRRACDLYEQAAIPRPLYKYFLANCYITESYKLDYKKALKFYHQAYVSLFDKETKWIHIYAKEKLNWMYKKGYGIDLVRSKKVEKLRSQSKLGNKIAQYKLALALRKGLGVFPDQRQSINLFRKSAKQGHAMAMYQIGFAYSRGRYGVKKASNKAQIWYKKALTLGVTAAKDKITGIKESESSSLYQSFNTKSGTRSRR